MSSFANDIDLLLPTYAADDASALTTRLQSYSNLEVLGAFGRRILDLESVTLTRSFGWGGYPYPPTIAVQTTPTSGDIRAVAVQFKKGDVVTGLGFGCTTAATVPTLCRLALYSSAYALLASTVDDTTLMTSTGMKEKAFSSPYTFTADAVGYLGIIVVASTYGGIMGVSANAVSHIGRSGYPRPSIYQTGQTNLTNPIVPVVPGSNAAMPWMAWY